MADITNLGKKAETKVKEWLDRPEEGYCFYRIPDQLSGFYGSTNPCDFILYKKPNFYFLESKATYNDAFPFSMITDYQRSEMLKRSKVEGVRSYIIILFASHQRAFLIDINDIEKQEADGGPKSINIKKIDKWTIPYVEIPTIFSRKSLLDYDPEFATTFF